MFTFVNDIKSERHSIYLISVKKYFELSCFPLTNSSFELRILNYTNMFGNVDLIFAECVIEFRALYFNNILIYFEECQIHLMHILLICCLGTIL